jgi:hypothetical protein
MRAIADHFGVGRMTVGRVIKRQEDAAAADCVKQETDPRPFYRRAGRMFCPCGIPLESLTNPEVLPMVTQGGENSHLKNPQRWAEHTPATLGQPPDFRNCQSNWHPLREPGSEGTRTIFDVRHD